MIGVINIDVTAKKLKCSTLLVNKTRRVDKNPGNESKVNQISFPFKFKKFIFLI